MSVSPRPLNPFSVFTPEGLSASVVVSTFSTLMPGLDNLRVPGHAFVTGARGSGKSILFRYLEPDCQALVTGLPLSELPHFSFYISFRETEAQISELARFDNQHGQLFFNEHLLVLSVAARVTSRLLKNGLSDRLSLPDHSVLDAASLFLIGIDGQRGDPFTPSTPVSLVLSVFAQRMQSAYRGAIGYAKKRAFRSEIIPYEGELFGFDDFLLPYLSLLRQVLGLPPEQPTFLLLDDADSLTENQTRIINSWVARRLSGECSLKVAAQITAYKTTLTSFGARIEAPHDYQDINLTEINTRSGELNYRNRIASIVTQRLRTVGVQEWPPKFFEEDHRQAIGIEREAEVLRNRWGQGTGRGHRARDDVQRYARPEFIRKPGGNRKSRSKYSYSGFDQLTHISSGVPRFFLEAAADMYERASVGEPQTGKAITSVPPSIQNDVIRDHAQRQFI